MTIPKQDEKTPGLLDEIRVPLHSLQADIGYLFGRVAADGSCADAMAQSVRDRLNEIERAYTSTDALRSALASAMRQAERDLTSAHAEICKLQGLDPDKHDWPAWSAPANTFRWFRSLREKFGIEDEQAHAALSGSPAPSIEGLREALAGLADAVEMERRTYEDHRRLFDPERPIPADKVVACTGDAFDAAYARTNEAVKQARTALAVVTAPSEVDAK